MSLTTAELTQMRADIETLLPDTGDIHSITKVSDGQGGDTETWAELTGDVACRVDAMKGEEVLANGSIREFHGYMLTVPHDTTITTAHRFIQGGKTFNILSVNTNQAWIGCKRLMLEEVI